MKKSIPKKTKEVIEKELDEMNHIQSLMELTRIGARIGHQSMQSSVIEDNKNR